MTGPVVKGFLRKRYSRKSRSSLTLVACINRVRTIGRVGTLKSCSFVSGYPRYASDMYTDYDATQR